MKGCPFLAVHNTIRNYILRNHLLTKISLVIIKTSSWLSQGQAQYRCYTEFALLFSLILFSLYFWQLFISSYNSVMCHGNVAFNGKASVTVAFKTQIRKFCCKNVLFGQFGGWVIFWLPLPFAILAMIYTLVQSRAHVN